MGDVIEIFPKMFPPPYFCLSCGKLLPHYDDLCDECYAVELDGNDDTVLS